MADEIPEHELNEWLKTLFFALERTCLLGRTNYQLQLTNENATFPDTELSLRQRLIKGMLKNRKGK